MNKDKCLSCENARLVDEKDERVLTCLRYRDIELLIQEGDIVHECDTYKKLPLLRRLRRLMKKGDA